MLPNLAQKRFNTIIAIGAIYAGGNFLISAALEVARETGAPFYAIAHMLDLLPNPWALILFSFASMSLFTFLALPLRSRGRGLAFVIGAAILIAGWVAAIACSGKFSEPLPNLYAALEAGAVNIWDFASFAYSWFSTLFFIIAILGLMIVWSCSGIDDTPGERT